jgi:Tol biopolymer transport system component/DNA-binding winged helix-turn-helix (wHTH) protein
MQIAFDNFILDCEQHVLWREDFVVPLPPKAFDTLRILLMASGRLVTKQEFMSSLWSDRFVEESNLTQNIFILRQALASTSDGRPYIETIPKRGYRFAVKATRIGAEQMRQTPSMRQGSAPLTPKEEPEVHTSESLTQITLEEEGIDTDGVESTPVQIPTRETNRAVVALATGERWLGLRGSLNRRVAVQLCLWVATAIVCLSVYLTNRSNGPDHLRIATYTQVTHDGRAKSIGGTDGSRIYFTQLQKKGIAQVSVSGGAEVPLQLPIEDIWSGDVSPDGSTLLIRSQADGQGPANSLWSFRLVGGPLRRLGNAVSSAWSPDGKKIVYAAVDGGIFVMLRDGSDAHRIASSGGYVMSMAWSPDGNTIRFSRDGLLWQISPDGTHLRQLLPGWGKSPTQWSGEWALDGRFFFVADGQIWLLENGRGLGRKVPASPVQLTFGPTVWDRPIPSPYGKQIFASGRTRRGELVRFETNSAEFKPFLAGISAEFVTFSSDRKSVAYVSYPEGILWRANLDGSNPIQLTEPPVYPKSVRWSPDGSQIAFVDRGANGVNAVFVIASDGSGKPQCILLGDRQAETDPSWSPDGRKIAFSTSPNVGATAKSDLRVLDMASHTVAIIPASDGLLVPRWSPDGRSIAAMTLDTVNLRLFNLSSKKWTKLDSGAVAFPEWSHDGRWIYYVRWRADPEILRIRAVDGKRESVAALNGARYTGAYTLWMGLDQADAPMMLRDEGTDDIYALTLESF